MTIPAMMQDSNDEQLKTAFKKTYSDFSQTAGLIMLDNGGSLTGAFADSNAIANKFAQKMPFTKICYGTQNPGECFHDGASSWHKLDGSDGWTDFSADVNVHKAIMNNGSIFAFKLHDSNCNNYLQKRNGVNIACGWIVVDINGFKPPNTMGKDMFSIHLTKYGITPFGGAESYFTGADTYCKISGSHANNGHGCAALVLQNKPYAP